MNNQSISIHEHETITHFAKRIGFFGIAQNPEIESHTKMAYRLVYNCLLLVNYNAPIKFKDESGNDVDSLYGTFFDEGFNMTVNKSQTDELYSLYISMQKFIDGNTLPPQIKQSLQLAANEILKHISSLELLYNPDTSIVVLSA